MFVVTVHGQRADYVRKRWVISETLNIRAQMNLFMDFSCLMKISTRIVVRYHSMADIIVGFISE